MITRSDFPDDFLFGAATSAYQIEGHDFGGAGKTLWDTFAQTDGNVINNETGAIACDHYHRFEADLDLMRGFDAYRFSTSWARVMPDGKNVNPQGLDFYDRLVDAILKRGLKPFLTLYHWDMPAALADKGGWTNPDVMHWFGDFTDAVMDRIGDRVASVATINEPWCVTYLSYFLGHHAPGLRDISATAKAVHNVLCSHAEAMARLRARGQENLGIVLNFEAVMAASQTPKDLIAADRYGAIMNRLFLDPLINGQYPTPVLDVFAPHLPANWQDDMAVISEPLDWLGVNYYTCQTIGDNPDVAWPNLRFEPSNHPKTQMGWDVYADGLQQILQWVEQNYAKGLPLFVTENGMALAEVQNDTARVKFITEHLQKTLNAIQNGCNVQGYFYWSLLDNFEWAFGYEKRFGLVHVDFDTLERTPKASFEMLKKLALA